MKFLARKQPFLECNSGKMRERERDTERLLGLFRERTISVELLRACYFCTRTSLRKILTAICRL